MENESYQDLHLEELLNEQSPPGGLGMQDKRYFNKLLTESESSEGSSTEKIEYKVLLTQVQGVSKRLSDLDLGTPETKTKQNNPTFYWTSCIAPPPAPPAPPYEHDPVGTN